MLALQRGHKHGALAELIPGVERLQEKLRVVDKNLGELKETTEAAAERPGGGKRSRPEAAYGGAGETEAA
jgi:hypothetical protein